MSQHTLADVVSRLDRLEAALQKLIELSERIAMGGVVARSNPATERPAPPPAPPAPTVAPPPPAPSADARREPPKVTIAPPTAKPAARPDGRIDPPVVQVAPPAMRTTVEAPRGLQLTPSLYDPYADRTDLPAPPVEATVSQVLARVFEAGLMVESEDTFALLSKLTHSSQMVGPRALEHYRAFAWSKLRRSVSDYCPGGDPTAFTLAYTEPADITSDTEQVRVFVKAWGGNRMPVPVAFARDPVRGGAWRVTTMSL